MSEYLRLGRSVLSKVAVESKVSESDANEQTVLRDGCATPAETVRCDWQNQRNQLKQQVNRAGKNKVLSAFTLSLVAFAAINAGLAYTPYANVNPEISSYRGWSWWTVNDIRHATRPANVVLLGSSLMVAAIAECDANYVKHSLDLATYRGATYLDQVLHDKLGGSFNTMNLSAPGQMPSDAYLTLKASLKEGMKPDVIVYGVAPRDFIDGTMQSPSDTEAFKYLQRSVDISDCGSDFYASPFGKFDWLLQRSINLYRISLDCRLTLEQLSRKYLSHNGIFNLPEQEGEAGPFATRLRALLRPFNIEPGTFLALQTVKDNSPLIDNRRDYMDRYKNPDQKLYATQFRFLERIIRTCKERNIKLILVQMPITLDNVQILKPAHYTKYKNDLARVSADNKIALLDLCKFEQYDRSDYRDTVHLNGYGGKKFVDNLVTAISADAALKPALTATGERFSNSVRLAP
ncbi:MAG TPA: DUF1574 family protein [Drouetiella sp.]|jgi:Protein of unknown function (DUF1574)